MTIVLSNLIFIVSAASGTGKTSLVKAVLKDLDALSESISHTTRIPRPIEHDGEDYYFVSPKKFEQLEQTGKFVECATVFDHRYGTSIMELTRLSGKGIDVILDIDWKGAQQIRRILPQVVSIFILPPSYQSLEQRLVSRAQDTPEVIRNRLAKASQEIAHYTEYDYLITNDQFDQAAFELKSIIQAKRCLRERQMKKNQALLQELLSS